MRRVARCCSVRVVQPCSVRTAASAASIAYLQRWADLRTSTTNKAQVVAAAPAAKASEVVSRRPPVLSLGQAYLIPTLRISRDDKGDDQLRQALEGRNKAFSGFFDRNAVILDIGDWPQDGVSVSEEFAALLTVLKECNVLPVAVCNTTGQLQAAALAAGLPQVSADNRAVNRQTGRLGTERGAQVEEAAESLGATRPSAEQRTRSGRGVDLRRQSRGQDNTDGLHVHHGTVRSGQEVRAEGKSLVIMGSVRSGAEVLASGDIHVLGTLKGRAHAGVGGNTEAKILVANFDAELVGIGSTYLSGAELDGVEGLVLGTPTVVSLEHGKLLLKSGAGQ